MSRISALPSISLLIFLSTLLNPAYATDRTSELPVPEFFGVYAVVEGELTELRPHASSSRADLIAQMGLDWEGLSRTDEFLPGPSEFIYFSGTALLHDEAIVFRLGRVEELRTLDIMTRNVVEVEHPDEPLWHPMGDLVRLRAAPYPAAPDTMIRLVPERLLEPGVWAVRLGAEYYDFLVGPNSIGASQCLIRNRHMLDSTYEPCRETGRIARRPQQNPLSVESARVGTVGILLEDTPVARRGLFCRNAPEIFAKGTLLIFGARSSGNFDWTARDIKDSLVQVHYLKEGKRAPHCAWLDSPNLELLSYPCPPDIKRPITSDLVICDPFGQAKWGSTPQWRASILEIVSAAAETRGVPLHLKVPEER